MDPTSDETGESEERLRGLESAFGKADDTHLHGVVPFCLGLDAGGTPDVVTFSHFRNQGRLYVTSELVGTDEQKPNSAGQYELAVCQREGEDWALDVILKLAFYTLETPLEHGETMDISPATPRGSDIVAFLFRRIAAYTAFGKPANVMCCVGITESELMHSMAYGSESLFAKMPAEYVLTESKRRSFV